MPQLYIILVFTNYKMDYDLKRVMQWCKVNLVDTASVQYTSLDYLPI